MRDADAQTIRTQVLSVWNGSAYASDYDMVMDNRDYEPTDGTPWLRFSLRPGPRRQAAYGGVQKRYRTLGQVIVSVFLPRNSGDGLVYALSEVFRTGLENQTFSGVVFRTVEQAYVGLDGQWNQWNVRSEFYVDDVR